MRARLDEHNKCVEALNNKIRYFSLLIIRRLEKQNKIAMSITQTYMHLLILLFGLRIVVVSSVLLPLFTRIVPPALGQSRHYSLSSEANLNGHKNCSASKVLRIISKCKRFVLFDWRIELYYTHLCTLVIVVSNGCPSSSPFDRWPYRKIYPNG